MTKSPAARPRPLIPNKVCPVVLRSRATGREILAFTHPRAGCQLVKGTIEPNESVEAAALRELSEEAGLTEARVVRQLGVWPSGHQGQVWAFVECKPAKPLPDSWSHHAGDDGGHEFKFFWYRLHDRTAATRWHPLFRHALKFIEKRV